MLKKIDDVNFADLIIVVIVFLLIENQFKKGQKYLSSHLIRL